MHAGVVQKNHHENTNGTHSLLSTPLLRKPCLTDSYRFSSWFTSTTRIFWHRAKAASWPRPAVASRRCRYGDLKVVAMSFETVTNSKPRRRRPSTIGATAANEGFLLGYMTWTRSNRGVRCPRRAPQSDRGLPHRLDRSRARCPRSRSFVRSARGTRGAPTVSCSWEGGT